MTSTPLGSSTVTQIGLVVPNIEEAIASLEQAKQSKAREMADAQLKLSEAQLQLDQVEERRERSLLARKASSQEDFDKAVAKRKQSEATVESNKANAEQQVADFQTKIQAAQAKIDQAYPSGIVTEADPAVMADPVLTAVDDEAVQMFIAPAERRL